ncbi:MAG: beta-galactosidase [Candidatus Thorarchaeota archaeon]
MSEISWDKYALKINGKKIFFLSGEFHYWRIPDRERWFDILRMYKIAGLNSIRIYFHWGYHNPAEDKFYFKDNRDIDYLLRLCEEIGLYVFIAAGPYICAETNAGGYPGWLLAKRNVRIKHVRSMDEIEYDPKYMEFCRAWYKNFIPNIKNHQISENPFGCVIAFQIENEYLEEQHAIRRYMEELIQYAREFGITVPNFHNDALELGSWNGLVDLYGFDKYPIWATKSLKEGQIPKWRIGKFKNKIDQLEKKVRTFGKAAAESPIFIPELQGGWFNHWGIPYGYDELYNFYGSTYQKMILQSLAAQGSTMMILYMFYGGTTWGALPNPEVYTSYDYSGCIREYGYQSDRLRHVRLFSLFAQSFNVSFINTDWVENPALNCSEKGIFYRQRRSLDGTDYYFFKNFNKKESQNFIIQLPQDIKVPKNGMQTLDLRDSYIAIGNHELDGFFIQFCSLNIILKANYAGAPLLVVLQNGGELLLTETEFEVKGIIEAFKDKDNNFTRFAFPTEGYSCITNAQGKNLYIICLSKKDALTLNADFSESDVKLAWGAYSLFFTKKDTLEIETFGTQKVWFLINRSNIPNFDEIGNIPIPGLKKRIFGNKIKIPDISLKNWYEIQTDWSNNMSQEIWKEIDFNNERDPIDHFFTSGHVLYKCEYFTSNEDSINLKINTRHKTAIWLNGHFIGGHQTYNIKTDQPGAMNGNDPPLLGAENYDLSRSLNSDKNVLYIITENLGHNKNFFVLNDVRNPRGILSAEFSKKLKSAKWYIAGIDVTQLEQPYNTSGLPGEKFSFQVGETDQWRKIKGAPTISPNDQIIWYKTQFKWKAEENVIIPLRIHLEGKHNVNIFLNGLYIGRYWGEYGPQHDFYIINKLLKEDNLLVLACWTTKEDNFSISIKPYKINLESGNIDENGIDFAIEKHYVNFKRS